MILAFHGSPGVPEDFAPLKKALGATTLQALPRRGYPGSTPGQTGDAPICLGYSFGSVDCLEHAANSPLTRMVILVAPYLFPESVPSRLKKALIQTPGLGSFLLKKAGSKAIDEMLVKSSHPFRVPANYKLVAEEYKNPAILRTATLEKENREPRLKAAIQELARKRIPVVVIRGDRDQSSPEATHLQPLRKLIPTQETVFEDAGHALLWTHTDRLASEIHRLIQVVQDLRGKL